MSRNSLSILDNRTGQEYEVEITDGSIRALELRQIKTSPDDFGLITYDPGFSNTASCRSKITFIDGGKGILRYRGYPIEQLAENTSFLEVAHLIFEGELPDPGQLKVWETAIGELCLPPEGIKRIISGFHHDSLPMAMLMSCVAALSGFYPEGLNLTDAAVRRRQLLRLIGQVPALAAYVYRFKKDLPFVTPRRDLPYTRNFLRMVFHTSEADYQPNPVLEKALDVLFLLHADHEQNCSANAMRSVGSSRPDPYLAASAAVGALAGPLHGGANEAVLRMLDGIGSKDRVAAHIRRVKGGEVRLMGFGHRVYKNYDPRAKIIKRLADEVFQVTGTNPLLDIALELEKIALEDDYFVSRKLYPNVDFYSGLIYQAMGFPSWMFPILFAVARMSGWVSQWEELVGDKEQRIARPRQVYDGPARRDLES